MLNHFANISADYALVSFRSLFLQVLPLDFYLIDSSNLFPDSYHLCEDYLSSSKN